jgi:hypothetical protein
MMWRSQGQSVKYDHRVKVSLYVLYVVVVVLMVVEEVVEVVGAAGGGVLQMV